MDKNKIILIIVIVVMAIIALVIIARPPGDPGSTGETDNLVVAATIFPLQSIVSEIGAGRVEAKLIVPSGASPHTFEPTVQSLKNLQSVSHIFTIGLGLDDWAVGLLGDQSVSVTAVSADIVLLPIEETEETAPDHEHEHEDEEAHDHEEKDGQVADDHHHNHSEYNPHYWLSVTNGRQIAKNIAVELTALDPDGAETYQQNLDSYLEKLDQADLEIKNYLTDLSARRLLTFHNAWPYFARDYDLEIVGTFEPIPGKEPTPQYLKELQEIVTKYQVKTIFSEPQLSTLALNAFLQDMKINVAVLDPLGGGSEETSSFIDLMKYNARIISDNL